MKKVLIFIILSILVIPTFVLAKTSSREPGVTCSDEEMLVLQKDLSNVKLDIEMLSDDTVIENEYGNLDVSNRFKVSAKNLPSQYEIDIYPSENKSEVFLVTDKHYSIIGKGGVYTVDFKHEKCGLGIIKSYQIMIPYFDKSNKNDFWFDGTYEAKPNQETPIWNEIINSKLLLALIALVIIMVIFIIITIKKSKKKIKLNMIFIILLSMSLFGFADNVFADLIVDSGGLTLDPAGGICDNCSGSGTYIMTGVGFKMSLVNVTNMYSISSFIVLNNQDSNVPGGLPLAKYNNQYAWYYNAIEAAREEGVYGDIGPTYSTSLQRYSTSSNMEISDTPWFLNPAGYNRPNVNSSEITKRLFGENQSSLQPLFYEYLYRLLRGNESKIGISSLSSSNAVSTLINSSNKVQERQKLADYRMIAEPIYIARDADLRYHVYTIKAAYIFNSQGSLNISYPQFKENFIASQTHGQINNPSFNSDVRDSKSGYGYVVYGITDKETVCDPRAEVNKCCYVEGSDGGIYNRKSTGEPTKNSYYCPPDKIGKNNECLVEVLACVPPTSTCEDTKTEAVCNDKDGTKAVFHENNNLKECTLNSEIDSGFTIVSKEDTTPISKDEEYCEVACKDDFDFELPMKKFAMAGTYFVLDQYTPKVNIMRTCITSKINYSTFKSDFDEARDDMIKKYNNWQDFKHILANLDGQNECADEGTCTDEPAVECPEVSETEGEDGEGSGSDCEPYEGCSGGTYGSCTWEIYPVSAINYSENNYPGETGSNTYTDATCCGSNTGTTYESALSSVKETYSKKVNSAKSEYYAAKLKYDSIVSSYSKCGSWINEKKTQLDPKLKLTYPDIDSKVFDSKNLEHDKTLEQSLATKITYWVENSETNNEYTQGGDNTKDYVNLIYVTCSGQTCTQSSGAKREFLTSGYIKREEKLEYTYHLPTLYTAIPSGRVYLNKNGLGAAFITLEQDSVPVNVKTLRGLYDYDILVSKITDTIRDNAKNKEVDNFKNRFKDSKVISGKGNDGTKYVCDYKIENDIYEPKSGENLFFYRPVEIEQINPLGRDLGYNWNDTRASVVKQNMFATGNDYRQLTEGRNDKFEFTLTPTVMKTIREYNVTHDYGGFNLRCSDSSGDDYYCKSVFLDCLASLSTLATSSNLCNNILEGRNLTNPTDYGYDDLQANRNILVNKLKSLPRSDI